EKEKEKEKGNGSTSVNSAAAAESAPGKAAPAPAAGAPGAGSTSTSTSTSGREGDIQTGRKLTQRLGKASAEGSFNKDEVLKVLQKLGELEPSRELLQQSGCGKAVASSRKYFSGGAVKHGDKEVAAAASNLRTRWMNALAGGSGGSGGGSGNGGGGGKNSPSAASRP
ncbi:unnamed protein product, partial [Scytosiphon promiscuus]